MFIHLITYNNCSLDNIHFLIPLILVDLQHFLKWMITDV